MSSTTNADQKERPIGKRALDAVDANFEESSFAEAIHALDEACSPSYAPHGQHIRQLLFVAMYPHPKEAPIYAVDTQDTNKLAKNKIDRQKMNHPTPDDSAAALRVLHKFTTVNTPQTVLSAIASYSDHDNGTKSAEKLPDSNIASLALKFAYCKDCWSILKSGFMSMNTEESSLLASPRRKKRNVTKSYQRESTSAAEGLVDENAWPILDWLLCTLEKDERLTEESTGVRYSPLLLLQIPYPRDTTSEAERKELGGLLDLILFALKQPGVERKRLGGRLLILLTNLGSTIYVNLDTLIGSLRWRLSFDPNNKDLVDFTTVCAILPPTIPALMLKVLLCQRFINTSMNDEDNKPRPKPLGRRINPRVVSQAATPPSLPSEPPIRIARKLPIAPAVEIKRLCTTIQDAGEDEAERMASIACTMLISYDLLQKILKPEDRDGNWSTIKGELCSTIRAYSGINLAVALQYEQCIILLDV